MKSGLAKDADSPYIVVERVTGVVVTDCFVLRPLVDKAALDSLKYYFYHKDSEPINDLILWLHHLDDVWEERGKKGEG